MRDPWARDMRCDAVAGGAFGGPAQKDRVTIWHGMDTPARACGRHATYHTIYVFRGHAMLVQS